MSRGSFEIFRTNGNSRHLFDSLVLDVLCDDEESTLSWRHKPDNGEDAEVLGAVEGRGCLRPPRVVGC
jgi:hypothetical protein